MDPDIECREEDTFLVRIVVGHNKEPFVEREVESKLERKIVEMVAAELVGQHKHELAAALVVDSCSMGPSCSALH